MLGRWLLLVATLLWGVGAGAQETVRTADRACAGCHLAIYERYLRTPMANASGRAADHLVAGTFRHAASGVDYRFFRAGDDAFFGYADAKVEQAQGTRRLEYFLGSGHLGVTYLYLQDGYLLETPAAWYAATGGYDLKPGFGAEREMPPALPMEAGCLRCHMSGVAAAEPGTPNRYPGRPFAATGMTCESCHGDTAAHVRTAGKAAVVNPAKLAPERRDAVCIACHLEGDVTVKRAGHSALDYRPGDRIADFLSYFVLPSADPLSRGVSEVEQFAASRCKRASGDRMSCTSCHDAHGEPGAAGAAGATSASGAVERVEFYRAKCLTCHTDAAFQASHHVENRDCTSCHMPRSSAENIPHVAWTDHRILRVLVAPAVRPAAGVAAAGSTELRPIFSPEADERDAAMAAYTAVMTGLERDRAGALAGLKRAYLHGARDTAMLEALGVMSALSGEGTEAQARFGELLARDPANLTALSDMGIYLARQGDLPGAMGLLAKAYSRNADDLGLANNLARVQCAAGDEAGAKRTMAEAVKFSPGYRAGWGFACGAAAAGTGR